MAVRPYCDTFIAQTICANLQKNAQICDQQNETRVLVIGVASGGSEVIESPIKGHFEHRLNRCKLYFAADRLAKYRYCEQRVCMFVCLSVCPLSYVKNDMSTFHQIFSVHYL